MFIAALEVVSRKWKCRIGISGWSISADYERLTNTRYADDISLYAKSLDELTFMMEILDEELAAIGLRMHDVKTKILSTSSDPQCEWVDIAGMMIEILKKDCSHKYLGRILNMDGSKRIGIDISLLLSLLLGW